jgi:hypothetical protein
MQVDCPAKLIHLSIQVISIEPNYTPMINVFNFQSVLNNQKTWHSFLVCKLPFIQYLSITVRLICNYS